MLTSLNKKVIPKTTTTAFVDPFADPPTTPLYVCGVSETHSLIFNKFSLVDDHLLIVTNAFEHQQSPLTLLDLEAMWYTTTTLNGLCFYNVGPFSGHRYAMHRFSY